MGRSIRTGTSRAQPMNTITSNISLFYKLFILYEQAYKNQISIIKKLWFLSQADNARMYLTCVCFCSGARRRGGEKVSPDCDVTYARVRVFLQYKLIRWV